MRFESVFSIFIICASVLVLPNLSQPQSESTQPAIRRGHPEREIAQTILARDQCIVLHARGKLKRSIPRDATLFAFPKGESPALLFRLPDYTAPYILTIASPCNHGCLGFSKSIFAPAGLFFDANLGLSRELPFHQFESLDPGLMNGYRLEAAVLIDEQRKADRYLLIYTIGEEVGDVVHIGKHSNIKASASGSLELRVQTVEGNASGAETKQPRDALDVQAAAKRQLKSESASLSP